MFRVSITVYKSKELLETHLAKAERQFKSDPSHIARKKAIEIVSPVEYTQIINMHEIQDIKSTVQQIVGPNRNYKVDY